jgi:hypothetical protein
MATIRLRSRRDPRIIIEGPVGQSYDLREWEPDRAPLPPSPEEPEERTPPIDRPAPAALMSPVPTPAELDSLRRLLSFGDPALMGEAPPDLLPGQEALAPAATGLAARLIGPRVGVPPMVSEAVGSLVGEGINQATGITEPSLRDLLLAPVLSLAGEGAGRGIAAGVKRLPGAPAVLHEIASEQLPGLASRVAPLRSSAGLYGLVAIQNPPIPVGPLRGVVGRVQQELAQPLSKAGQDPALATLVKDLEREIAASPTGELPFQRLWATQKRIKDLIDASEQKGGQAHGAYELLRRGIDDAFDQAGATGSGALPVVATLRQANQARTREGLQRDLSKLLSTEGGGLSPRGDLGTMASGAPQVQVNANTMLKAIEKSPKIKRFMAPSEYEALRDDLARLAKELPGLGAPRGVDAGSKQRIARIAGGGATGTLIGAMTGADPSTAALVGGSVGTLAGSFAPEVIATAVQSPAGRALLRKLLLEGGGELSGAALATLAIAVGMSQPGRGVTQFGLIGPGSELLRGVMPGE